MTENNRKLLSMMPPLTRARNYRLYDINGRRYVDMYQNNGCSILGHRTGRVPLLIKQALDRGLISDIPSVYTHRFEKALKKHFPSYSHIRITGSLERVLELISLFTGNVVKNDDIADPAVPREGDPPLAWYWRPFCPDNRPEIIIPILPFCLAGAPAVVCFRDKQAERLPVSDILSPAVLSPALRSLYNLSKYRKPEYLTDTLIEHSPTFTQKGIYFYATCGEKSYEKAFLEFLKQGFLLSPHYPGPGIFPAELSDGEYKKMMALFRCQY